MKNRDLVKKELSDTAQLLLDAIVAERRMTELPPSASLAQAQQVQAEAQELHSRAMARFKIMCARLAEHVKNP